MSDIRTLVKMFNNRKQKLSMVLDDKVDKEQRFRVMGAIDELDVVIRTLEQQRAGGRVKGLSAKNDIVFNFHAGREKVAMNEE